MPAGEAGQILFRERAHSTKGKGLKSLESVVMRVNVLNATQLDVQWSYTITGTFTGLKATVDETSYNANALQNLGNGRYLYTFAGASFDSGDVVVLSYDDVTGNIANAASGNPARSFDEKPARNEL